MMKKSNAIKNILWFLIFSLSTFNLFSQGQDSAIFNYTGSPQTFEACTNSITVMAWGGGGGGGGTDSQNGGAGGGGSYITNTITVSPGQTLYVIVGGGGVAGGGDLAAVGGGFAGWGNGTFNGGRGGNPGPGGGSGAGGAGGGASAVLNGTTVLIVAGGGGGGGGGGANNNGASGGGGGQNGNEGGSCTAPGTAGASANSSGTQGVDMAPNANPDPEDAGVNDAGGGGGGGGGYLGGTGGGVSNCDCGGCSGGGGTSWSSIGGATMINGNGQTPGNNTILPVGLAVGGNGSNSGGGEINGFAGGNGYVKIYWTTTLPTASISGDTTVCNGATAPKITFTGANFTPPYTFTYNINGGASQTINSTGITDTVTIAVPTATATTYTYSLQSIAGATPAQPACITTATIQAWGGGGAGAGNEGGGGGGGAYASSVVTIVPGTPYTVIVGAGGINGTGAGGNGGNSSFNNTLVVAAGGSGSTGNGGGAGGTSATSAGTTVNPGGDGGAFAMNPPAGAGGNGAGNSAGGGGGGALSGAGALGGTGTGGGGNGGAGVPGGGIGGTYPGGGGGGDGATSGNGGIGGNGQVIITTLNSTLIYNTPGTYTWNAPTCITVAPCSQAQPDTVIITVNPIPAATISGTTTVCQNSTSPNITFTGANGTAPYIFTYNINGGANQTIGTTGGSSIVTIDSPTNTNGIFTYALVGVQDSSAAICSQALTDTAIVTVNPSPTATIAGTTTVCNGAPAPIITFTGANTTAPYTFMYAINGGANQTVSTTAGNSTVTITAPTTTPGISTYALISVTDASSATCSQAQPDTATVTVNPLPTATVTGTTAVCLNSGSPNITFTGANTIAPYTFIYMINGGANQTVTTAGGNSVSVPAPTNTSGAYTYEIVSVTDSNACSQTQAGDVTVTVNQLPTATIAGTTTVCQNSAAPVITFTGANTAAPYTFTYAINGGANQTISTTAIAGNSITVAAPTTTPGIYTYALISVTDASSATCSQAQPDTATVTINPSPSATIMGTTTVCNGAPSPDITFTGTNGTTPYTFIYTLNGGGNQTISTAGGNSVTIAAPTTASGLYTYALISVQDASSTACSQPQAGNAIITVNPLPTATIAGTTTVCQNSVMPVITFTGANTTAPYAFTYTIDGGANQIISTSAVNNTVTVNAPTNLSGIYTYALVNVQDGSSAACSNIATDSAIITVNPIPTATIGGTITVCNGDPSPNITFTGVNGTAPYAFTYKLDGGANQTINTLAGNSVTLAAPTSTVGTLTYSLVSVQDASSTTCSQAQQGGASVTVNPLPTATMAGTTTVCQNSTAPYITFTGANGTPPYTFTYVINGGGNISVTGTAGSDTANVPVSTAAMGTFKYILVSVQDASSTACNNIASGTSIVTVNPLPTATIAGTTNICQNAGTPLVTFTGMNGAAPYTIAYSINGGGDRIVKTGKGDSVTIKASSSMVGTFTYSLVSVMDGGSNACSQPQTGSAAISVNQIPDASFSVQPERASILDPLVTITDNSTGTNFWKWNFGDGSSSNFSASGIQTHAYADTGTYAITLVTTNQFGCVDSTYQTVIIDQPLLFYIPDAFTPNGDGKNDTFMAKGEGFLTVQLTIYDRWGISIFTSNDINTPWDGKVNGGSHIAQNDTYVYVFQVKDLQKHDHTYQGTVTLLK